MTPAEIDTLLQEVHNLRTLMIDVGTGKRRIDDAESDYTQLRSHVSAKLRTLGIGDTNTFVSLWDWYSYWKDKGLTSYQSRREYVNSLYKLVVNALEKAKSGSAGKPAEAGQAFSARHGYADDRVATEITIREEAPEELRSTIVNIAERTGWDCDDLFGIASRIGKKSWEPSEPVQSGKSSRLLLQGLMSRWEWYHVYDFIEKLFGAMKEWPVPDNPEDDFERMLDDYFRHAGIGWELRKGSIVSRGSEAFEASLHRAAPALQETGLRAAELEIHEALADLSRRPQPDITGAIQHAMAALECVARAVSGDSSPTLGKLLDRHPGLVPKPLDVVVEKAWGYASERGRHIREGEQPLREEAELIVGIAATVATYLARRKGIE